MNKILKIAVLALLPIFAAAQSNNVQSAWRAFEDYKTSLQEKKPDFDYLSKAKEKIDLAQNHADTKDKAKTLNYVCKIYYALFQYNWDQEKKKLAATITNANEAAEVAYGNVSIAEFETAGKAMEKVFELEKNEKEKPYSMELQFIGLGFLTDMQNLAVGRFKVKKYEEAMDFFESTYQVYKGIGKKDTNSIFNALLSAELGKKNDKVLEYGKLMMDDKVANAGTYNKIHFAYLNQKDTAKAEATLKTGMEIFPNDKGLILNYINICLQTKKEATAVDYIAKAIEKDPKNTALYLAQGGIYNDQANPKSPKTGRDTTKPANFEELIKKSETNYLKAIEINPTAYDGNFNLGAVYNNWGNWYSQKNDMKNMADNEKKAKEYWLKAIQYLEAADKAKPCDKGVMFNLKRLYYMTEQKEKGDAMNVKMKTGC